MFLEGNDDIRAGLPRVCKLQRIGLEPPAPKQRGGTGYPTSALASHWYKMTSGNRLSPGWTSSGRDSHLHMMASQRKVISSHAFSFSSGKQNKGAIYPTGGGSQTSVSRTVIWLGVPGHPQTLMRKGGCCRQHTSLSPSRGVWERTKLFSYLSCYLEQGEVRACFFPSPDDQRGSAGRQSLVHVRSDWVPCG